MDALDSALDSVLSGPAPDPLDAALDSVLQRADEDEATRDTQVGALYHNALTQPPERRAAVLELARNTGAPADAVEQRFDDFQRTWQASNFDAAKWRQENPALAQLVLEQPDAAPVVMRDEQVSALTKALRAAGKVMRSQSGVQQQAAESGDLLGFLFPFARESEAARREPLVDAPRQVPTVEAPEREASGITRPFALVGAAYRQAQRQLDYSEVGTAILARKAQGLDTWDLEKKAVDLERSLVARDYGAGPLEQVLVDAAGFLPAQLQVLLKGGGFAAVAGATAGGLTLATTRDPTKARAAATGAAKLAAPAGAFLASFELELGGAYLRFRNERTDSGEQVEEPLAVGAALTYAMVAAGLETAALGPFLEMLGPAGKAVTGTGSRAFLDAALRDRTLRNILADAGKAWLKGAHAEGKEEFLQSLAEDVASYAARAAQAGAPQQANPWEAVAQAGGAYQAAFQGAGATGAPMTSVSVATQVMQRDAAVRAGAQVAAITGAAGSPAAKASPTLVAELIRRETADSGEEVRALYVDADAFTRFFQEGGADASAAAAELLGPEGPRMLQEAAATGGKLEVPTAVYLERWGSKPVAEALAADTTTRPGYMTPRQLAAEERRVEQEAQALAKEYQAENAPAPESKAEQGFVAALEEQLRTTGLYNTTEAKRAVALQRAFIRTQAQRFGVEADALFGRYVMTAERVVEGAPATEALQQGPRDTLERIKADADEAGLKLNVAESQKFLTLSRIVVPEDQRGAGVGTDFMERLVAYADASGKTLALTPSTDFGATSKKRLTEFYKRFGFVENKGKRRDFETTEEMYRPPSRAFRQDEPGPQRNIPRGWVGMDTKDGKRLMNIALTQRADMSTFLHESGHVFLEMMADLAEREDAPAALKQDWQAALAFLGVESRDGIQREHHEKWARAFEAYLMEGKAPSATLVPAFTRFKLWLKQVYASLLSLDVELDDSIRRVFDRLLATDREIENQRRAAGLQPMFRSPEEAGMSPAQWQAYLDAQKESAAKAVRRAEARALEDAKRETDAWWREEEGKLYEAALLEYDARPDARAWAYVKRGQLTLPDGTVARDPAAGRLDRAAVEEALGPQEARRLLAGRLVKEGGDHPDAVAEVFGFPTGKALLTALQALPSRKEWAREEAGRRMREKHPGLMEERQRLQEAAAVALHNEQTAEWLLAEWQALRSKAGGTGGAAPVESLKRAAALIVEAQGVRRLNPSLALQQERAAAERAAVAAAKGDFAVALIHQQQRLLNHYLYRELLRAREEREAFEVLLGKQAGTRRRGAMGLAGKVFLDTSDAMLEALGVKEPEGDAERSDFSAYLARLEAEGLGPAFDEQMVRALLAQPREWRDLTVAQMRAASRLLQQLYRVARQVGSVVHEGKRVAIETLVGDIAGEAERLPDRGAEPKSESVPGAWWRTKRGLQGINAAMTDPEIMLQRLGPTAHRFFWQRYLDARGVEDELAKEVLLYFAQTWDNLPPALAARRYELVDSSALPYPPDVNREGPTDRQWMWMVALNMGNLSNRDRLLGGYQWSEGQVLEFLNRNMTAEEWRFVQGVWNLLDEKLWPKVAAAYEAINGVQPPKIEAVQLETSAGTLRGGYFPARYDPIASRVGQTQTESALTQLYGAGKASVLKSFTKERARTYSDVVNLQWGVLPAHLAQVVHYVAFDGFVRDAARVMGTGGLGYTVQRRLGVKYETQLHSWLKVVASAQADATPEQLQAILAPMGAARSRFVMASIGWSLSVAAGDFSNPLVAIGSGDVKARHMVPVLVGALPMYARWRRAALQKSPELRHRAEKALEHMRHELGDVGARGKQSAPGRMLDAVRETAFTFMDWTGRLTSTLVWEGAYRQALAQGMPDAEAVREADGKVRALFPSDNLTEQPSLLRDKRGVGALLAFYSYFSKLYNVQRRVWHDTYVEWEQAEGTGARLRVAPTAARAAGRTLAVLFFSGVVAELLSGRGPEGDEEPEEWMLRKMLASPWGMLPLFGSLGEAFISNPLADLLNKGEVQRRKVSTRAFPAAAAAQRLFEAVEKAAQSEEGDAAAAALLEAAGVVLKLPVSQPKKTGGYLLEVLTGEASPEGPGDVVGGIIYGERKNQPANPFTLGR